MHKLPCGVGCRYSGFAQTSLWRRKSVYRRHGMSTPGVGRQYTGFVFFTADWHRHARVIEIQTRLQLKNNCFHETQRIFMNKFCICTPNGQRMSYVQQFFKVTCLSCIFESTSAIFVWRAFQILQTAHMANIEENVEEMIGKTRETAGSDRVWRGRNRGRDRRSRERDRRQDGGDGW